MFIIQLFLLQSPIYEITVYSRDVHEMSYSVRIPRVGSYNVFRVKSMLFKYEKVEKALQCTVYTLLITEKRVEEFPIAVL